MKHPTRRIPRRAFPWPEPLRACALAHPAVVLTRVRTLGRSLGQAVLLSLGLCAMDAGAAAWYRWTDPTGIARFTRDKPALGVPYTEVAVADPIRWSHPPDMPAEFVAPAGASVADFYRIASPSVYWVQKRVTSGGPESVSYGSAVAIGEDLALTNCHVVGGAAGEILIGAGGGDEVAVAELVAADFEADRCVLQTRFMHLHPVVGLRRFDALEVGEAVYAIGNPRRLERTLSEGLLSGKRTGTDQRLLQTTAPISPGSSGGGLFDRQGNLLGITSSTLRGAQNVNFAVPAEDFWK